MPNGKVYGIEGTDPLPLHEINPLTGATNRSSITAGGGPFTGLARRPHSKSNTRFIALGKECFYEANLERLSFGRLGCLVPPTLRIYISVPTPPPFWSRSQPCTQF